MKKKKEKVLDKDTHDMLQVIMAPENMKEIIQNEHHFEKQFEEEKRKNRINERNFWISLIIQILFTSGLTTLFITLYLKYVGIVP